MNGAILVHACHMRAIDLSRRVAGAGGGQSMPSMHASAMRSLASRTAKKVSAQKRTVRRPPSGCYSRRAPATPRELELAVGLVNALSGPFDPTRVEAAVEDKAASSELAGPSVAAGADG